MNVHRRSAMDELVNLTQEIQAEPPTPSGDCRAPIENQSELNTETLTHEPVEVQTNPTMDAASASTPVENETPKQRGDCYTQTEQQSRLTTETLTHEPVEVQTQSAIDAASASTPLENETPTQGGDCYTQTEQQSRLNTETLTHEPVEVQTQSAIDAASASTPPENETPTQGGDCHTQTEQQSRLTTETLTYELVEVQTQSAIDAASASTPVENETPTQGGDCHTQTEQQSRIITETLTHEPVEELQIQSDIVSSVTTTQKIEVETLTPPGDVETQSQKDIMDLQKHYDTLLQTVSAISGESTDSSPDVLALKLFEVWQEREVEILNLAELKHTTEEKARTMKNKLDLHIKTLADPIRLITGITDPTESPKVLAHILSQTWDQIQSQNDDLELELKRATERVKKLEVKLEAQAQDIKCLAADIGVCLKPVISHSDVVFEIRQSFDDLHKDLQDRDHQRLDAIKAKDDEIEDLQMKMKALTSSLEDLQLLLPAESKKKGKKRSKKLRLRWWKKAPEQQEEPGSDLEKIQKDLMKKNATISLLEAKMTVMEDEMKKEKGYLEKEEAAKTELQNNIKLLQFDNSRKETLIQSLRDLVETLRKNRATSRYQFRNTVDHATVASMPDIKCKLLDSDDIHPFSGSKKPGDLSNMRVLGKGSYGKVYLGCYGEELRPIAIKQPILPSCHRRDLLKEEKERSMKESLMQHLLSGSPYFPKMLGVVPIGEELCMVMDFIGNRMTGKTFPLFRALTRFMSNPRLDLINMLQVSEDIIKGIMELHQKGYLHNDLKSNNVLLEKRSQRWHAVIIDLGLVSSMAYSTQRRFSDKIRAEYKAGKVYTFLAPEVVLYGQRYSAASDIFSFGVILKSIARKIQVDEVAELAEICTQQDPLQRPHNMEEVLKKMEAIRSSYDYF